MNRIAPRLLTAQRLARTVRGAVIAGALALDVPFWPGDASPFGGGVVTDAAFYRFAGTTVNIIDFNGTPRTADFSWSGRITDICAALS